MGEAPAPKLKVTVPLCDCVSPVGFAVIVIVEVVFAAAGKTVSQLEELPAVNDTAAPGTEVLKLTCCVAGVVEPAEKVVGVHDVRLGVTVGGAVPVATSVALLRLKLPEFELPDKVKLTVPGWVRLTDGMAAGTAVIIEPLGMYAVAFSVASPARSQLLICRVSETAPTLSVRTTVTAGVDVALQLRDSPPTEIAIVSPL